MAGAVVEHEIVGPHLVRPGRRLRARARGGDPLPRPLTRHLQPCHSPQPVRPARAHAVAVASEKDPTSLDLTGILNLAGKEDGPLNQSNRSVQQKVVAGARNQRCLHLDLAVL